MSNRTVSTGQIPLPFGRFEHFDFNSFLPADNREAVINLQLAANGTGKKNIYLWGKAGTGKSHLLQAVCTHAAESQKNAAYIPLAQATEISPELLQGLEQLDLICIDDLEQIAGRTDWEQEIFHLFNRLRDRQRPLIIAAKQSPRGIAIALPDLKSRLSWDLGYHLLPLDDETVVVALKQRAQSRMFDLPDDVADFIVNRVARDTHSLFNLLDQLDTATLASKKKLTIPFVKDLLVREEDK